MKLAIVVGHNPQSQGAVRTTDRRSEYVWNGDLAERIQRLDANGVRIFRRTPGPGEISRVYRAVAAWRADCAIELHFNGHFTSSANGCETLYGPPPLSKKLAQYVNANILEVLRNRNRGLKYTPSGRGSTAVGQRSQPTILVEPYFGTNPGECDVSEDRKNALARAIYNGAREFLGKEELDTEQPEESPHDAEMQRIKDVLEEIGDACVSALTTGYDEDAPEELKRLRWNLAAIFKITQ